MVSILCPLSVSGFYTHSWCYIYELCSYLWLSMPARKPTTVCPISWRGTPEPFPKGKSFIQRILKRFINNLHSLVCISRILPRTELEKYSQVYVTWHHALGWGLWGGSKLTRRFLASSAENLVPPSRAQEPRCREHTSQLFLSSAHPAAIPMFQSYTHFLFLKKKNDCTARGENAFEEACYRDMNMAFKFTCWI